MPEVLAGVTAALPRHLCIRGFRIVLWLSCVWLLCWAGNGFAAERWGTYDRPFMAQSPWNSRPVHPEFADPEIPKSNYYPAIAQGTLSTGVFLARVDDEPILVYPPPGRKGVWDPDAEAFMEAIKIPRWPSAVMPASGSDGHAEVVDPILGVVHSFWQLKNIDGRWQATQYAWTRIGGRGWGDPAHYMQGARAAGVASLGGLIRKHEVHDGQPLYKHALAISLTFNALSANPTYVFPATASDHDAGKTNSGNIPMGSLLMLPADYDTSRIGNPQLRKVAETLKIYGGYVVDRNYGTPFLIYVENGSDFKLHANGWDGAVAKELDRMRASLRRVSSAESWLGGDGRPADMSRNQNLLSMRGPWRAVKGTVLARYDSWAQALVFPEGGEFVVQANVSGRNVSSTDWAKPQSGRQYILKVRATGGARLRLELRDASGALVYDSGELGDARSALFAWPAGKVGTVVTAYGGGPGGSVLSGELVRSTEGMSDGQ